MVREAIIHAKWRSNIKTSHRILRKQSPLSPRNDQPTSLTIARQSYIYQASSFSFMNSINQLRNYISRKKQCVSLNPSQLSLDSVNCVYSCEEGVSSKKKKKKIDFLPSFFASLFHRNIPSLSPSFLHSPLSFSFAHLFFFLSPFFSLRSISFPFFLALSSSDTSLFLNSIPPPVFFTRSLPNVSCGRTLTRIV